jgi:hypothetical protein
MYVTLVLIQMTEAFQLPTTVTNFSNKQQQQQQLRQRNNDSKIYMVGDFFSGITGQAPKSLDVPFDDLLSGTNIDPEKDNVDLQCVYKASRDGWSAIDFHESCDGRGMLVNFGLNFNMFTLTLFHCIFYSIIVIISE